MKKHILIGGVAIIMAASSMAQSFASEATGTLSTSTETTSSGTTDLSGTVVNDAYSSPTTITSSQIASVFSFSGTSLGIADIITSSSVVNFTSTTVAGSVVIPAHTDITSNTATFDARDLRLAALSIPPVALTTGTDFVGGLSFGIEGLKLNFSKPLRILIPVSTTNPTIEVLVKHATTLGYSTTALTNSSTASCSNGVASPQSNIATVSGGYATIYTCSASTFVGAVTPAVTQTSSGAPLPVSSGSSGGGGGSGGYVAPTSTGSTETTTITDETNDSAIVPPAVILTDKQVKFKDISNNWAKEYIVKLAKRGIINNTVQFKPDSVLTRAEFLKIALKAANMTATGTTTPFADVKSTDWYASYVALAVEKNIISSKNANFRPNDTISRAEVAKIMVNIFGAEVGEMGTTTFSDVDVKSDLAVYIEKAVELGIFNGQTVEGKKVFRPMDSITRAEIAKVVANAFKL